jgi:hypothetical protein
MIESNKPGINWKDKEAIKEYHKKYYNKQKLENKYNDCVCGKKYLIICEKQHLSSHNHKMYLKIKDDIIFKLKNL